jgi:1-acyl-sn-glycerol-3-phosphate acyltransferase
MNPSTENRPQATRGDSGRYPTGSASGVFWANADPKHIERIHRYNETIGSRLHRFVQKLFLLWICGPIITVLMRIFCRVQVIGVERLDSLGSGIIAARHFYEWDPAFFYTAALWTRAFFRTSLTPLTLAGHFWTKTRPRRIISWCMGIMGVVRGEGLNQGAVARAAELVKESRASFISIFPTGPIGRSRTYDVKPGVGYLALRCPDVPVIPVTIVGLQELELRSVLRLERPLITIVFGTPFTATEVDAATDAARIEAICDRIGSSWSLAERRLFAAPPVPVSQQSEVETVLGAQPEATPVTVSSRVMS